jgi:hypothetical protein
VTRGLAVIALLVLSSVLCGCATGGKMFSGSNVAELRLGLTTEADAVLLFGQPYAKQTRAVDIESIICHWLYVKATAGSTKGEDLAIEFVDRVANGYIYRNSLEGEPTTDFDLGLRDSLKAANISVADARRILGQPHGEVRLPSNLLANQYGSLPEVLPPESSAQALVYNYSTYGEKDGVMIMHLKLLVLFLDKAGTVIAVRHFEGELY